MPLHCSYGQIGYTVYFPYSNMPEVEYDWEMNQLTIDHENWESYLHN
jgi:hypothetical protein